MNTPEQGAAQLTTDAAAQQVYTTPAIVYEGTISTRAGSPVGPGSAPGGVDPADLFGDG